MPTTQPDGVLARPVNGKGRAVLVLHAWWGLNETIRQICQRLADAGYVAFAPDLYHGKVASEIAEAEQLGQALDANFALAKAEIAAAARFVSQQADETARGVAVLGFSLGAYYALDLAAAAPNLIDKVVLFYGTGGGDWRASRADYLGHFASDDPYEPPANHDQLAQALTVAGRSVDFQVYPNTGHWFCESDRVDAYQPEAAALAWARTLDFLNC